MIRNATNAEILLTEKTEQEYRNKGYTVFREAPLEFMSDFVADLVARKDDPPAAPTGLTASGVAHDSVTISWAAPGQGSVTGYRILRGTDSNSLSAIVQNTDSTATEYTDSTVAAETTYHYAVLALSAEGDGAQSAAVSATTPAAPQQATVPDLRLSSTAAGQLTISWDTPQPTPSDYRIIWAAKR